jgi:hypothetical protein
VGNGNRTRNRRSHSPVLYQLSYSHRLADYSNCRWRMSERFPRGCIGFLALGIADQSYVTGQYQKARSHMGKR